MSRSPLYTLFRVFAVDSDAMGMSTCPIPSPGKSATREEEICDVFILFLHSFKTHGACTTDNRPTAVASLLHPISSIYNPKRGGANWAHFVILFFAASDARLIARSFFDASVALTRDEAASMADRNEAA
ncbi:hypothetical protein D9619_011412 [Psilocybe cf. subviscida]|uniref:Uncharacterized protein n=1 Tax=Psilocybe cf. subviscida TaxID=2480587 RepID=A0A8H5BJW1_9AGAR|nr:hypothetical protein D9619_011412 [Psilocybe cf. subviscida]